MKSVGGPHAGRGLDSTVYNGRELYSVYRQFDWQPILRIQRLFPVKSIALITTVLLNRMYAVGLTFN